MPILSRYITREILKYFFIILAIVLMIFIASDYLRYLDDFLENKVPVSRAVFWVFLRAPATIAQVMPVITLLAVLITFGLMVRSNEIVAVKSSGISIYTPLKTVLFIGFILSVTLFFLAETVIPITSVKSAEIKDVEVQRKRDQITSKRQNIWIKGTRQITHIEFYNSAEKAVFNITINFFDDKFKLIRRVDAKKGVFLGGRWMLFEIIEQRLDAATGEYLFSFHEKKPEPLDFLPEDLKKAVKQAEEMNYPELREYIKSIEAEGFDASLYKVGLYAKLAYPAVCMIMCCIGMGLSIGENRQKGLPLIIGKGIGVAFIYWILYSFCLSVGYGGMLPPFIAAWITNIIFVFVGAIFLMNAE